MEKNYENNQELEQMRQTLNALKARLDNQEIINERLLRESMKSKMSWINKYLWSALLFVPIVALCFLPMKFQMGTSWWLYGFTILMVAGFVCSDWIINRMNGDEFLYGNLSETVLKLREMKKTRARAELVGIVFLVGWIAWLAYEVYTAAMSAGKGSPQYEMMPGYLIGMGVGLVIGGIAGLHIYFKMQRTNDEIIRQIENMQMN